MTKASIVLAALLLGAISHDVKAQTGAAQNVEEETVRRLEKTILLRKTIEAAQSAQKQGDVNAAAKLYEDAWGLAEGLGDTVNAERADARAGFSAVRFELAERAAKNGDYKEADAHIKRALRVDPNNVKARDFKRENDRRLAETTTRTPSDAALSHVAENRTNITSSAILVQDGKLFYEMRELDKAEKALKEALRLDPENEGAFYYINLVKEARFGRELRKREVSSKDRLIEIEKAWNPPSPARPLPEPNIFARTNRIYTGRGRQAIHHKLDTILLDELKFPDQIPLSEAIKTIDAEARRRDPEGKGVNFIIASSLDPYTPPIANPTINPTTGLPEASAPAETVDLNLLQVRLSTVQRNIKLADALDIIVKTAEKPIKISIEDYAVVFTQARPEAVQLYTRRFRVDPNTFMQGLESVTGFPVGATSSQGGSGGGSSGGGGGGSSGGSGSSIFAIPRVDLTGFTSSGAQGSSGGGGVGGGGGGGGGVGGGGGSGIGGIGISGVTRTNMTASVQIMVRDFFRAAGVDFPATALPGAGGAGGGGGGFAAQQTLGLGGATDPGSNQKAIFFNDRAGILFVRATLSDLDIIEEALKTLNAAPPQISIEAKFAEVTQNDAKAVGFDWFLGNWLMGGSKGIGLQGGSAPTLAGAPTAANPYGSFPGSPTTIDSGFLNTGTHLAPTQSDQNLTTGVRNEYSTASGDLTKIPALATVTGILTDPQFRMVIRAIEQREGVDLLSAPKVITLSGRQAKVEIADVRTIVTGLGGGQGGQGGQGGSSGSGGGGVGGNTFISQNIQVQYSTQSVPFGPSLDVIPYVSADDYSIQMTIIPSYAEFLGYDDPKDFVPQFQAVTFQQAGQPLKAVLPLPRFRARSVTTSAIVWDGQTVALGGLIAEDIRKQKDKVPVLGDVPLLGRLFRSESSVTSKKNLLIFVTPTIIDPAGNRVHDPNNLPYDPNSVPPQSMEKASR